jgi:hypothetical protein
MNTLIQQQQQQQIASSNPSLSQQQQQQQHIQALTEKSDSSKQGKENGATNNNNVRLVPSGKVYRQLFEAQVWLLFFFNLFLTWFTFNLIIIILKIKVQLSEAYEKVKEKYRQNPPNVLVASETSIPLIREGRSNFVLFVSLLINWIIVNLKDTRGIGILNAQGQEWIQADTNEIYTQNPIYLKYPFIFNLLILFLKSYIKIKNVRYKSDEKKINAIKEKKRAEREDVAILPDTVG